MFSTLGNRVVVSMVHTAPFAVTGSRVRGRMKTDSRMKRFAIIGVGGYVAPRHLKAIKDTGNVLEAALDPNDSVGVMDGFFPDADFFTEFERFDRHIDKLRRKGPEKSVEYVSICSPNYLHDAHIRFALRSRAHAICEKPLVLNPWNVDALKEFEKESDKKVYTILQLRKHPAVIELKRQVESDPEAAKKIYDIDLTYITSRGRWYQISWKGDQEKSGGVATNIGIHFFDMLLWIFGPVKHSTVHVSDKTRAAGYLELERARVRWFLSLEKSDLPSSSLQKGQSTYRAIRIESSNFEFSGGFTNLHTISYKSILAGEKGFGLDDGRPSIQLAHDIRVEKPNPRSGEKHPLTEKVLRTLN